MYFQPSQKFAFPFPRESAASSRVSFTDPVIQPSNAWKKVVSGGDTSFDEAILKEFSSFPALDRLGKELVAGDSAKTAYTLFSKMITAESNGGNDKSKLHLLLQCLIKIVDALRVIGKEKILEKLVAADFLRLILTVLCSSTVSEPCAGSAAVCLANLIEIVGEKRILQDATLERMADQELLIPICGLLTNDVSFPAGARSIGFLAPVLAKFSAAILEPLITHPDFVRSAKKTLTDQLCKSSNPLVWAEAAFAIRGLGKVLHNAGMFTFIPSIAKKMGTLVNRADPQVEEAILGAAHIWFNIKCPFHSDFVRTVGLKALVKRLCDLLASPKASLRTRGYAAGIVGRMLDSDDNLVMMFLECDADVPYYMAKLMHSPVNELRGLGAYGLIVFLDVVTTLGHSLMQADPDFVKNLMSIFEDDVDENSWFHAVNLIPPMIQADPRFAFKMMAEDRAVQKLCKLVSHPRDDIQITGIRVVANTVHRVANLGDEMMKHDPSITLQFIKAYEQADSFGHSMINYALSQLFPRSSAFANKILDDDKNLAKKVVRGLMDDDEVTKGNTANAISAIVHFRSEFAYEVYKANSKFPSRILALLEGSSDRAKDQAGEALQVLAKQGGYFLAKAEPKIYAKLGKQIGTSNLGRFSAIALNLLVLANADAVEVMLRDWPSAVKTLVATMTQYSSYSDLVASSASVLAKILEQRPNSFSSNGIKPTAKFIEALELVKKVEHSKYEHGRKASVIERALGKPAKLAFKPGLIDAKNLVEAKKLIKHGYWKEMSEMTDGVSGMVNRMVIPALAGSDETILILALRVLRHLALEEVETADHFNTSPMCSKLIALLKHSNEVVGHLCSGAVAAMAIRHKPLATQLLQEHPSLGRLLANRLQSRNVKANGRYYVDAISALLYHVPEQFGGNLLSGDGSVLLSFAFNSSLYTPATEAGAIGSFKAVRKVLILAKACLRCLGFMKRAGRLHKRSLMDQFAKAYMGTEEFASVVLRFMEMHLEDLPTAAMALMGFAPRKLTLATMKTVPHLPLMIETLVHHPDPVRQAIGYQWTIRMATYAPAANEERKKKLQFTHAVLKYCHMYMQPNFPELQQKLLEQ